MDVVDQTTDTLYVANFADNTVSVIDGATCNGIVGSGCAATPPSVKVGDGPQGLAVDEATDTVYTTNGNDNTVSVINGKTCNSTTSAGCGQTPAEVTVAGSPGGAVVDQRSHTVYVIYVGASLGGVALIDGARCNGQVQTGCAQAPGVVQAGSGPISVAENPVTGTVYVANQEDSNVSVINARTCNAAVRSGCTTPLPAMAAAFNAGGIDIDVATDTIYYTSQAENVVSVLDGSRCNAQHAQGCTAYPPTTTTGNGPSEIALNQRDQHAVRDEPGGRHRFRHQRRNLQRRRPNRLWPRVAHDCCRRFPQRDCRRRTHGHHLCGQRRQQHRVRHRRGHLQRP